jgi:hypothetical protein
MTEGERPLGVTIIGILWISAGLFALSAGMGVITIGTMVLGIFGFITGIVLIILGIIDLALGVGCFKAWPWVWTVAVIIAAINIITGVISIFTSGLSAVLSIIIPAIILYYMMQPQVKAWFGKL